METLLAVLKDGKIDINYYEFKYFIKNKCQTDI